MVVVLRLLGLGLVVPNFIGVSAKSTLYTCTHTQAVILL
jgi:hypothetical protein